MKACYHNSSGAALVFCGARIALRLSGGRIFGRFGRDVDRPHFGMAAGPRAPFSDFFIPFPGGLW